MPWRNWDDDDELLRDIRDALRPEPLEVQVLAAARDVQAWRATDPDQALAALLYDSAMDTTAAVRAPLSGTHRNLVFALGELRVELELSDTGIEGQLIPPEPGGVRLCDETGLLAATTADEVGCFTLPAVRSGPIRLECTVAGRQFTTEWIGV